MTMTRLLLMAAILVEVAASLSLKGSASHPVLYVVVITGYVAAFILLAQVLKRGMALGVAYGIWGASGVALTAVLSSLIFGEPLTPLMGAGLALIMVGVLVVETGSRRTSPSVNGNA